MNLNFFSGMLIVIPISTDAAFPSGNIASHVILSSDWLEITSTHSAW